MHRLTLLFFLATLFSPIVRAQGTPDKIACYSDRQDNAPHQKKLWGGYEISLGPSSNPDAVEEKCTGAIYNSAGKVVFRTNGFSVVFDETVTGKDFDGDEKPEVVFRTDTGGGMHCCWAYIVLSLSPKPHKLFEIDMQGRVDFDKDKDGKVVIWKRTAGPYGFTSMARTPFAEKVLRVRDGKLVDATPEFCGKILSDESEDYQADERWLTRENLKKLQTTGTDDWNNEEIVSALLSRALQHVFCGRFDEAMKALDLWPEADRAKMKIGFADAIHEDYPAFAAKLREAPKSK
jgi:hypothetical protein